MMGQPFGEDMGILAAALEMLELEQNLYTTLAETMPGLSPSLSQNRFLTKKMMRSGNALASCCPVLYRHLMTTICIVWM